MNENKVAFIICVNDDLYASECVYYINHLIIPANFAIDIITIKEADGMAAAYNAAMMSSDAKYKVYLHQDVFILNRNLINDFLDVFQNEKIGMIGVLGRLDSYPQNALFHYMWDIGYCMLVGYEHCHYLSPSQEIQKFLDGVVKVCAIDGMFMITQYDVPWNEQVIGWHFYDIAQCIEMQRHGYEIVLPYQKDAWILHDAVVCSSKGYDEAREIFCGLYNEYGFVYDGKSSDEMCYFTEMEKYQSIVENLEQKEIERAKEYSDSVQFYVDRRIPILQHLFEIREMEMKNRKFSRIFVRDLQEQIQEFHYVKFLLRRIAFGFALEDSQEVIDLIMEGKITSEFVVVISRHNIFVDHIKRVIENVMDRCQNNVKIN